MGDIALPLILFGILTTSYLWLVWRFPPAVLLANVTYSAITKIVSCLYMEINTIYLIEMGTYSGPTGATVRQLVHHAFIYAGALFVLNLMVPKFWKPRPRGPDRNHFLPPRGDDLSNALMLASALCAVQFINVLVSPNIPIFTGTSRQIFWNYHIAAPILRDLIGVLMVFVPCIASYGLGVSWARRSRRGLRLFGVLLAAYFVFLIVSGQKFNGLMIGIFLAVGPAYILARASTRKIHLGRWGLIGTLTLLFALSAGAVGFGEREISRTEGGAVAGIVYRAFAMQGSVYYVADKIAASGERASPSILYGDSVETIRTLVPDALADAYEYAGVSLAGSLPGNSSMVIGFWPTIIVCLLYGLVFGFVVSMFIRRILSGNIFQLFLLSYIYMWTVAVYSGGSFDEMISVKYAVFVLALIGMQALAPPRKVVRRPALRP